MVEAVTVVHQKAHLKSPGRTFEHIPEVGKFFKLVVHMHKVNPS